MNAEQVVEKILSDARKKAEEITDQARKRAEQNDRDLDAKLEDFRKETSQMAEEAAEDRRSRMLARARMDQKKQLLTVKAEILNDVFKRAADKINSLEDEQYRELMGDLMEKAVETGDEEVIVGKNENRLDQNFVKQVNRRLVNGYKGNLNFSDHRENISGGFVLRRGDIRINVSTEVLVSQVREDLEMELSRELFGQE